MTDPGMAAAAAAAAAAASVTVGGGGGPGGAGGARVGALTHSGWQSGPASASDSEWSGPGYSRDRLRCVTESGRRRPVAVWRRRAARWRAAPRSEHYYYCCTQ